MTKCGFSVIEALVALAIAAIGLLSIFSLQQQLVKGQQRYEQVLQRVEMERNALALLRDVNPVERPKGTLELPPGQQLTWTSRPLNDFRQTTGFPTGSGVFEVRLFQIDGELVDERGRRLATVTVDRLGWRRMGQARDLSSPAL